MKRISRLFCLSTVLGISFLGCESSEKKAIVTPARKSEMDPDQKAPNGEPAYVTVQHCLIGFRGSLPGKQIKRSREEARELATQLLAQLKEGANFDDIIVQYTDDSPPGIYKMANHGIELKLSTKISRRDGMVAAFGDVGFPLQIGEYGLAAHEPQKSPFGWHIIKRIE